MHSRPNTLIFAFFIASNTCELNLPQLSEIRNLSRFRCEIEFIAHGCEDLKKELEKDSPELVQNLKSCDSPVESEFNDNLSQAKRFTTACFIGIKTEIQSAAQALKNIFLEWVNDTVSCNESRKIKIYEEYNLSLTEKEDEIQIPSAKKLLLLGCDDIRSEINAKLLGQLIKRQTSLSLEQRFTEADHFIRQLGAKKECYRPEVQAELICSSLVVLGGITAGGSTPNRSSSLAKISELTGIRKVSLTKEILGSKLEQK